MKKKKKEKKITLVRRRDRTLMAKRENVMRIKITFLRQKTGMDTKKE
jgi:hypothetical protein